MYRVALAQVSAHCGIEYTRMTSPVYSHETQSLANRFALCRPPASIPHTISVPMIPCFWTKVCPNGLAIPLGE